MTAPSRTRSEYPPEHLLAWTPRQREVLDLLAKGRSNPQIAETLDVSLEGAKWHVREIMSKLDVDSREDAAEYWRQRNGLPARLRRTGVGIFTGWSAKTAAAGAGVVVGVIGVAVLAFVLLNSGGDPAPVAPGETPPDGETTTPTPPRPGLAHCPVTQEDICDFAATLQQAMRGSEFDYDAIVAGSAWEADQFRPELEAQFQQGFPGGPSGDIQVVSIGCAFDGPARGCDSLFAVTFSDRQPGIDPGEGDSGILILGFDRHAENDFEFRQAHIATDRMTRRGALNGGQVQECDIIGRPAASQGGCVRMEFRATHEARPDVSQPEFVDGVQVRSMDVLLQQPAGIDGVIYIDSGCWGCDGPTSSLDRVWQDAAGTIHRDVLFEAPGDNERYISGLVVDADSGELWATVCSAGYCGGLGYPTADAQTTLHRSTDGGILWEQVDEFEGAMPIRGVIGEQLVIQRYPVGDANGQPTGETETFLYPGMEPVVPPDGIEPWRGPIDFRGQLAWESDDGTLVDGEGIELWRLPLSPQPTELGFGIQANSDWTTVIAYWNHQPGANPASSITYLAVILDDQLTDVFRRGPAWIPVTWLSSTIGMTNGGFTLRELGIDGGDLLGDDYELPVPVFVDYAEGTVRPIEPGYFLGGGINRNIVRDYRPGTFFRVTGAGTCLNVREEPTIDAAILGCFADNVLLHDLDESTEAGDITWRQVRTPGGEIGWASAEFLAP